MRRDFISTLRCPYTGSHVHVSHPAGGDTTEILFGVLTTEAGEFPVIAGILRFLNDGLRESLVQLVREGRHDQSLMMVIEDPVQSRSSAFRAQLARAVVRIRPGAVAQVASAGKRRLYSLLTQPGQSLAAVASDLAAPAWRDWQLYRFSMPTFLPVYAFSHLAAGAGAILDFGCGLGHSSFLMSRIAPSAQIVCADYSFTSLFLASRFMVPDAQCVCLDGDYSMPFAESAFDLVFSTDALQYVESKVGLVREFRRIIRSTGSIVLAHLHNGLSARKTGTALTPAGYDGLFKGMHRRLYAEREIVNQYVADGALLLSRSATPPSLEEALDGVSLVASESAGVFADRDGLHDAYIDAMRSPRINPAYAVRRVTGGDGIELERQVGEPYASSRTIAFREILPMTWLPKLPAQDSDTILALKRTDRSTLIELVRRFVVLDLPEAFCV